MSGICGWIGDTSNSDQKSEIIRNMAATLRPYNTSADIITGINCALSSNTDLQGNKYSDESVAVVIEGNPRWSDPWLAQCAKNNGHAVAVAQGFKKHGTGVLDHLFGAFSLAIISDNGNKGIVAIDRLGNSRITFSHVKSTLVFGSRADNVSRHPLVQSTINNQAIYSYIYFHMIPSPLSVYSEQEKLLPGEYITFNSGKVERKRYWNPTFDEQSNFDFSKQKDEFFNILHKSVGRLYTEGKTGAFLSGGVDSSTVSGILNSISEKKVQTYSIGFAAEGYDEMEYARITSRHFGTDHHEYYVTPDDVINAIPLIADSFDEPFGNSSAIPTYYCARLAKEDGIDNMLAGDGGDELFAGNSRYALQKVFEAYSYFPEGLLKRSFEKMIFGFPAGQKIRMVRQAQGYIRQAKTPLPERMESFNFLHRTPLETIFNPDFLASVNTDKPIELLKSVYQSSHADSTLNKMLYLDWKFTLADNDLRKVNGACELAGVKVHYPLLDDDLLEFSTHIPSDIKLKRLKLRYFMKQALKDFLPEDVITKKKHGFGLPFGVWLKTVDELQDMAYESLRKLAQRGYLRDEFVNQLIKDHQEGHAAFYGSMIWVLMMLEQWLSKHEHG